MKSIKIVVLTVALCFCAQKASTTTFGLVEALLVTIAAALIFVGIGTNIKGVSAAFNTYLKNKWRKKQLDLQEKMSGTNTHEHKLKPDTLQLELLLSKPVSAEFP